LKIKIPKLIFPIAAVFASVGFVVAAMAADDVQSQQPNQPAKPAADEKSKTVEYENAMIKMMVIPRTREQMKAFYEGRGFSQQAIATIAEACFMTVVIKNKTDKILWLELDNWQFHSGAAEVERLDRAFWMQRWEKLHVPVANRSTFGWTLLPERRDLRAEEGVGGNITMKFSEQAFNLTAKFLRGEDKQTSPLTVQLNNLQCIK